MSPSDPSGPVVILKPRAAQPFFNRHPWVFTGAVSRVTGQPFAGSEVAVKTAEGKFVAWGLFNPDSNIRVRLYSWDEQQPIDSAFLAQRLDAAIAFRREHFTSPQTNAYRLVFSESDGLSGLTVDKYGDWLLIQITSRALAERREVLFDLLQERLQPAGMWLRTEKGIGESEGLQLNDGLVRGIEPPRPLRIMEKGLIFSVDVAEGQKTGAFLDQRENRWAASRFSKDQRVLDLFCYSGGFGIYAAAAGANAVIGVDSSQSALNSAQVNATENQVADRMQFVKSDVFKYLEQARAAGEVFDVVVLDPPKMARQQAGHDQALRGYHSLNALSASLLRPGGILVTCSCSGRISRTDFEMMLSNVSTSLRRPIQILETRGQPADHPVSPNCPENSYLKCYICRVV